MLQPVHLTYRKESSEDTLKKVSSTYICPRADRQSSETRIPPARSGTAAEQSSGAKGKRERNPNLRQRIGPYGGNGVAAGPAMPWV